MSTDVSDIKKPCNIDIVNSRFYTCAGCRALFKTTNNGDPFVWCYLSKRMVKTEKGYLDKRLDFEVFRRPVENCKVRTNKTMVAAYLNGYNSQI